MAGALGSRGFVAACLVVAALLIAFARMYPIDNPDFGWHVALGRAIYENRAVPTTETFSHTAYGKPMVAHEWLSELIYYVVIRLVDVLGLRWLHVALTLLILWIAYRLLRRLSVSPALSWFGTFLFFVIAHSRFHIRPHIFDILCLLLAYGYLFLLKPALGGRQLAGIFLFTVVWANLHSGVVRFAAIVLVYLAVEALQQLTGWRKPLPDDLAGGDLRRLSLLAALVVLALVITPNHFRLFHYIAESRRINVEWSVEWQPIFRAWGTNLMAPLAVPVYGVVAAAAGIVAGLTWRRSSLSSLAVMFVLTFLPLSGIRFVDGAFAPVIFLVVELERWLAAHDTGRVGRRREALGRLARAAAPLLTLSALYPVLGPELYVPGVRLRPPGGRVLDATHLLETFDRVTARFRSEFDWNRDDFPIGAVNFLDEVNLQGRLFNTASWGGYVLFRTHTKYPVFIDGRWIDYGEDVFKASLDIEFHRSSAAALLDRYGIDVLLVPPGWSSKGNPGAARWIPVFANYSAAVFVRDTALNAGDLERCAIYYRRLGIPFDRDRGFDARAAIAANPGWARHMGVEE